MYDSVFEHIEKFVNAFGTCELTATDFSSNGVVAVNTQEFEKECQNRGYNSTFVNALQAKIEEKSGWYYRITKI